MHYESLGQNDTLARAFEITAPANHLIRIETVSIDIHIVMDLAYSGNKTRTLIKSFGYNPAVPLNPHRVRPWDYDRELYKKRSEPEGGYSADLKLSGARHPDMQT